MLRMSKLSDYGTVMMTVMARAPERVHSATELATSAGVTTPTACKVLKILARGGLVVSVRGARGGYLLACPPERITLAEVISAMEGPIGITECTTVPGLCAQEADCSIRGNWLKINRILYEALRQVTLADMARPALRPVDISAIRARSVAPGRNGAGRSERSPV